RLPTAVCRRGLSSPFVAAVSRRRSSPPFAVLSRPAELFLQGILGVLSLLLGELDGLRSLRLVEERERVLERRVVVVADRADHRHGGPPRRHHTCLVVVARIMERRLLCGAPRLDAPAPPTGC